MPLKRRPLCPTRRAWLAHRDLVPRSLPLAPFTAKSGLLPDRDRHAPGAILGDPCVPASPFNDKPTESPGARAPLHTSTSAKALVSREELPELE